MDGLILDPPMAGPRAAGSVSTDVRWAGKNWLRFGRGCKALGFVFPRGRSDSGSREEGMGRQLASFCRPRRARDWVRFSRGRLDRRRPRLAAWKRPISLQITG